MQRKLTLRLEETLIQRAKRFSRRTGKSASRLVSEYFETVNVEEEDLTEEVTPQVETLRGILKHSNISEADYQHHLDRLPSEPEPTRP